MTETQERFLRAVAERLPLDRVAELHLFPSIRQGGVETGVAVIAVEAADLPTDPEAVGDAPPDAAAGAADPNRVGMADDGAIHAAAVVADRAPAPDGAGAEGPPPRDQRSAAVADLPHHPAARRTDPLPAPRHTIFSARYRLTLKGPDRGRWEAEVVAEADAPLATADAVVRGVRKRTGEAAEAERIAPELLRQLADQPA